MVDTAIAYHVTMRLADDRVIAHAPAARRLVARVLVRCGTRARIMAFRVADTHVHALVACTRAEAGSFARAVEAALRYGLRLPVPFEAARVRPVTDQRHLVNAFRYIHQQEERHGIAADPVHDGSSLPDLLGLRTVGAPMRAVVDTYLPRLRTEELLSVLGNVDLAGSALDLRHLADAAAAAMALPCLAGRGREERTVQAAAIALAKRAGATQARTAALTGLSVRTVRRYWQTSCQHDALGRAIMLQLRLRTALERPAKEPTLDDRQQAHD